MTKLLKDLQLNAPADVRGSVVSLVKEYSKICLPLVSHEPGKHLVRETVGFSSSVLYLKGYFTVIQSTVYFFKSFVLALVECTRILCVPFSTFADECSDILCAEMSMESIFP